ncbi:glutathione hydrolase 6 [Tachyglossus aculeatus]|uniref:glutathione hydrolase 6 n=1 Tax=Tachyglossus aculeatus TaxID=9261 RepID=UPI0018F634A6|nr:glutathione hydrolase 6 [Tachyglossus aculeatus]
MNSKVEGPSGVPRALRYQQLLLAESGSEGEEDTAAPLCSVPPRRRRPPRVLAWASERGRGHSLARLLAALVLLALAVSLALRQLRAQASGKQDQRGRTRPWHHHEAGVYPRGAVISQADTCSRLGRGLLVAGGNVVDAGIGTALCLGLVHPHVTGLGAAFWGLFHNGSSGLTVALTPPLALALAPGLGRPTALPALRLLHRRLGHLPWARVLADPIAMAQNGVSVDAALAGALEQYVASGRGEGLCPLLCHPDGTPLGPGTRLVNPQLGAVLQRAAGAPEEDDQFQDALLRPLARDLPLAGRSPFATSPDALPSLQPALSLPLRQGWLFTTPVPVTGAPLLNLLSGLREAGPDADPCPQALEAAQLAYASAPSAAPAGSSLAAMDSSGSVLLLSSSLNSSFGSGLLSPATGLVLSDFEGEAATHSWTSPALLCCGPEEDVLGVVATAGPAAPLAVAQTLLSHLVLQQPAQDAVASPLLRLQLGSGGFPSTCTVGAPLSGDVVPPAGQALLLVTSRAEHVRTTAVPAHCCPSEGY